MKSFLPYETQIVAQYLINPWNNGNLQLYLLTMTFLRPDKLHRSTMARVLTGRLLQHDPSPDKPIKVFG